MKKLDEGFIVNAQKLAGPRRVCTFTSLFRLDSGEILATYRLGSAKNSADGNCQITRSMDHGQTWEVIHEGFESTLDGVKGEIRSAQFAQRNDGVLLAFLSWVEQQSGDPRLYDPESDTARLTKLVVVESNDDGRTWSRNRVLATGDLARPLVCGQTVRLPGKGWLVPVENYAPRKPGGACVHSAHAVFSGDGREFDAVLSIARHPEDSLYYWDQRVALCSAENRLVNLFWTYDRKREEDVDIHISWADAEALSWTAPVGTGLAGQIAAPIPLPDGRLLAFYVRRKLPGSLKLIASPDGGKTWDQANELVVFSQDLGDERGKTKRGYAGTWEGISRWTFGHPVGITLDENVLLVVYYAGAHEKCLSVRWARVSV